MSSIHPIEIKIDIQADHSCNWRCCLSCRGQVQVEEPRHPECLEISITKTELSERIAEVVKKKPTSAW